MVAAMEEDRFYMALPMYLRAASVFGPRAHFVLLFHSSRRGAMRFVALQMKAGWSPDDAATG